MSNDAETVAYVKLLEKRCLPGRNVDFSTQREIMSTMESLRLSLHNANGEVQRLEAENRKLREAPGASGRGGYGYRGLEIEGAV